MNISKSYLHFYQRLSGLAQKYDNVPGKDTLDSSPIVVLEGDSARLSGHFDSEQSLNWIELSTQTSSISFSRTDEEIIVSEARVSEGPYYRSRVLSLNEETGKTEILRQNDKALLLAPMGTRDNVNLAGISEDLEVLLR